MRVRRLRKTEAYLGGRADDILLVAVGGTARLVEELGGFAHGCAQAKKENEPCGSVTEPHSPAESSFEAERTLSDQGRLRVGTAAARRATSLRELLQGLHGCGGAHRLGTQVASAPLAVRLLVRLLDALLVDVFAVVEVAGHVRGCGARDNKVEISRGSTLRV